ncbi:MAG: hypothetical protein M1816_007714 [Peltula sp. TS41687]|nr:MAG: hypothetical protein M1816_007714 [Peltula sp. TS41687]
MKPSYLFTLLGFMSPSLAVPALIERDPSPMIDVGGSGGGSSVQTCWTTLSCSFKEIETWTMPKRASYVRYMQSTHFGPLKATNKFRAIEAVIDFFYEQKVGAPGTWVSWVDAGIVEAIQRGGAIALGKSKETGGNPGASEWATYFNKLKAGQLNDRDDHDKYWSTAEQAGTDYGKRKAESTKGVGAPSAQQKRWYQFTQLFRFMMRHRTLTINALRAILLAINPFLVPAAEPAINWLTDVTNYNAAHIGLELSWAASELDVPGITISIDTLKKFSQLLVALVKKYKENN